MSASLQQTPRRSRTQAPKDATPAASVEPQHEALDSAAAGDVDQVATLWGNAAAVEMVHSAGLRPQPKVISPAALPLFCG